MISESLILYNFKVQHGQLNLLVILFSFITRSRRSPQKGGMAQKIQEKTNRPIERNGYDIDDH